MSLLLEERPTYHTYAERHFGTRRPLEKAFLLAEAMQSRGDFEARRFLEGAGHYVASLEASAEERDAVVVEFFEGYQKSVHGLPAVRTLPLASLRTPEFRIDVIIELSRIDRAGFFEMMRRYIGQASTYKQKRSLLAPTKKRAAFAVQALETPQAAALVQNLSAIQVAFLAFDLSRLVYATEGEVHQALVNFFQQIHKAKSRGLDWCRDTWADYVAAHPERAAHDLWEFWSGDRFTENLALQYGMAFKAVVPGLF